MKEKERKEFILCQRGIFSKKKNFSLRGCALNDSYFCWLNCFENVNDDVAVVEEVYIPCVCARDSSNHKISFQRRRKEKPQHSMNGDCVRNHIEIEVVLLWNQQNPSWTPTNCFSKRMQTISFYNDKHNTYTKRGGIRRFSVIKKQAVESTLNRFARTKNEPLQRKLSKTILLLFVMSSHNQSVAGAE